MFNRSSSVWGIDCHAHALPLPYVDELLELAKEDPALAKASESVRAVSERQPPQYGKFLLGGLSERVDAMHQSGIAIQVISSGSSLAYPEGARHRAQLVRLWNDSINEEIQNATESFRMFASVPLPDVDAAIAESARVADRDSTVGFCINTHILGSPIDDTRWQTLYQVWNEMAATVFVHPDGFCVPGIMDRFMEVDVGTQLDDTLAAARLITSGIFSRFPRINWLVAHLGGTLPFILGRMDEHWERDRHMRSLPDLPSRSLDRLYVDTAGHDARAIRFAVDVLGAERVVLGSDFPAIHADDLGAATRKVADATSSEETARQVLNGTAARLLAISALREDSFHEVD